jgi:hypothetical protein
MSRRIKKTSSLRGTQLTAIARQVRGVATSLAIPTILAACAPAPHVQTNAESTAEAAKTVLYVGPKEKETEAEAPQNAQDSPAGRYVPLLPDIPNYEKAQGKHRFTLDELVPRKRQRALGKNGKLRIVDGMPFPLPQTANAALATPAAGATPTVIAPPTIKSMKDGIWDRMRKRMMLTGIEQDRVTAEVEKLKQSPGKVSFLAKRAEPFLF